MEHVRIFKETLKLLNNGENRLISNTITCDKTHITVPDISMCQGKKVRVFEGEPNQQ